MESGNYSEHQIPDWRLFKGGTRQRVALWLIREVGENGVFSKADLRAAFPRTEQIDRRMRDLRQEGWVIATYREDRSLSHDQLRLVKVGGRVWQEGYVSRNRSAVTDKQRQQTLAEDGYACRCCGIAAGEPYPEDQLRMAKLSVERCGEGPGGIRLRTVCDRCLGSGTGSASPSDLLTEIASLDSVSRAEFANWVRTGRRTVSRAERIWGIFLSLPGELRSTIAEQLHGNRPGGNSD